MQQQRHEYEHIKSQPSRSMHDRQMLADVWQQNDEDDDDVSIIEPSGYARPQAGVIGIPQPVEEEEEEEATAGDTFMVSPALMLLLLE